MKRMIWPPSLFWKGAPPTMSSPPRRVGKKTKNAVTFFPRFAWNNGIVAMNLAMCTNAFLWLFTKQICLIGLPIFQQLFIRGIIGFVVLIAISMIMGVRPIFGQREVRGWIIARTCLATVAVTCVYGGIYLLPVGDASALKQLSTVFIAILGWALGWQPLNLLIILGCIACSTGAVLVSHPPFLFGGHEEWDLNRKWGIVVSLCAAAVFSVSNLLVGKIGKSTSTVSLMIWFDFGGVVSSIIPMFLGVPAPPKIDLTWSQILLVLGHAMLSLVGQILVTRGFQLCHATKGAAIQTLIVVYCYILGYFILHEPLTWFAIGGTVCVMGGIVAVAEGKRRAKKRDLVVVDVEDQTDQ